MPAVPRRGEIDGVDEDMCTLAIRDGCGEIGVLRWRFTIKIDTARNQQNFSSAGIRSRLLFDEF
jgi:hypothetical protein